MVAGLLQLKMLRGNDTVPYEKEHGKKYQTDSRLPKLRKQQTSKNFTRLCLTAVRTK